MNRPIGRRRVLAAVAAAPVVALGSKFAWLRTTWARTPAVSPAATTSNSGLIEHIGHAYLRQTPTEAHVGTLSAVLPEGWSPANPSWSELLDQVAADYASGAVVVIDGWRLSRTEARAAALSVLQPPRGP